MIIWKNNLSNMSKRKRKDETYEDFRERVFGTPYMVWHDGAHTGALSNVPTDEREHVAKMLTKGVVEEFDHVAVDAWGDFDPEAGVKILKPMLGESGNAQFRAALAKFLKKYDRSASKQDVIVRNQELVDAVETAVGFAGLDAVMAAGDFPTRKMINALLSHVEFSGDYLVRYHASNSLLKIAGCKRSIDQRSRLFRLIVPKTQDNKELPDTSEDKKRYKKASRLLRRKIYLRLPFLIMRNAFSSFLKSKSQVKRDERL
jgi:hypothetical protein